MSEINTTKPRRTPIALLVLGVAVLVCLFGNLGALGLVGPDEPRYVWIARAMAETGDWVTPRLYGSPWFEKPVLYYWCAALGFLAHLPVEWAARLPSALAALAAAVAIGILARKHYGGDASSLSSPALLTPVLFSTSVAAIGFARSATPDMLFSSAIALAMASAAAVFRGAGGLRTAPSAASNASRGDTLLLVLFGAFLGLGVLAKGPAAIILAGGAIGVWALATNHWRVALRVAHPSAIAAFCVVALPWYVLCAIRNPDFLHVFILQHNFERYLTPLYQHRQPFWFFGPIVLLALLPWTVLLWPVAEEGLRLWREKSWRDSPGFFFACWAVFPVAFFSLSQSKLPGYILPAIPPLALLCAVSLQRAFQRNHTLAVGLTVGLAGTWAVLASGAFFFARRTTERADLLADDSLHALLVLGYVALGAAILIAAGLIFAGFRQRLDWVAGLCAVSAILAVEAANIRVLPALDSFYSARPHAAFMRGDQHPERIFTYHLSRSWDYGLAFYFHRELPEWSPADPDAALVLTTPGGLAQMKELGRFSGNLDEPYVGVLYVPANRVPR